MRLNPPSLLVASVGLILTGPLLAFSHSRPQPTTLKTVRYNAESCSSCEARNVKPLSPIAVRHLVRQGLATNDEDPPADTPATRFDRAVAEARAALIEFERSPSELSVVPGQSMSWIEPSGETLKWSFDADGYVKVVSEGTRELRYHAEGDIALGYDLRDPAQGYSAWTTISSVVRDNRGYILSSTWYPTGETTVYDVLPAEDVPAADLQRSQISRSQTPKPANKTGRQKAIESAERARNQSSRESKDQRAECLDEAAMKRRECISRVPGLAGVGAGIVAGGGVGAGVGAAVGAAGGGVGALPGAAIGGLVGAVVGGISGIAAWVEGLGACKADYAQAVNNCNSAFERRQRRIRIDYANAVARAGQSER